MAFRHREAIVVRGWTVSPKVICPASLGILGAQFLQLLTLIFKDRESLDFLIEFQLPVYQPPAVSRGPNFVSPWNSVAAIWLISVS